MGLGVGCCTYIGLESAVVVKFAVEAIDLADDGSMEEDLATVFELHEDVWGRVRVVVPPVVSVSRILGTW